MSITALFKATCTTCRQTIVTGMDTVSGPDDINWSVAWPQGWLCFTTDDGKRYFFHDKDCVLAWMRENGYGELEREWLASGREPLQVDSKPDLN